MGRQQKIFCIGWAKTGTTSLGRALSMLGYNHIGSRLDLFEHLEQGKMQPLYDVADDHDAFDDWPWILLFETMARRYPDAKFVLTLRDEDEMVGSYRKMLAREWKRHPRIRAIRRYIYGFDTELGTDDAFRERLRRHNREVRHFFRDQPERLLEMDISHGDGWDALCAFTGHPIPDAAFPHANAAHSQNGVQTAVHKALVALRSGVYRFKPLHGTRE